MKIVVLFLFFCSAQLICAQKIRSAGGQFSYQAHDFFFGLQVASQHGRIEQKIQFQAGVRTTFFQQRFFPQASYQLTWYPVNRSWFRAGISLRPVFAALHVKKDSSRGYVFYESLLPGAGVSFGNRHRLGAAFMYGPLYEQRFSDLNNSYNPYFYWTFNAEISYSYAF